MPSHLNKLYPRLPAGPWIRTAVDDEFVRFGVFELELRQRELRRQGRRVRLQDKPFDLLALLVSRPGALVTREELQRHLWPGDTFVVFNDNLNAAVRKAREALDDSADAPRYIETVPRHGYRFIAAVEPVLTREYGAAIVGRPRGEPAIEPPPSAAPARPRDERARSVLVAVAAVVAVLLGLCWSFTRGGAAAGNVSSPVASAVIRFRLTAPAGYRIPPGGPRLAVSPDGQHVAFVAHVEPAVGRRVFVQSVDSPTPRAIPGSEEAFDVFWSPDSRALAFVAVGMLRTLPLEGGAMQVLGKAPDSSGGTWSAESGLLVAEGPGGGLVLFPPGGGTSQVVTTLDPTRAEKVHRFPQFLPDGRTFLYLAESQHRERSAIFLARLGSPGRTHLLDTTYKAEFVAPDTLLFVRGGRLLSQRIDLAGMALVGAPVEVVSGVYGSETGEAWFSSSSSGVLAYAGPRPSEPRDLVWFDADGRRLGVLALPATCVDIAMSPDDRHVALGCREATFGPPDIWLVETGSGRSHRLTTHPAGDGGPVWSPDGRTIFYARSRGVRMEADIYALDTASPQDTHPILSADGASEHPTSLSPDGNLLLFQQEGNVGKEDLWVWPTGNGARARPWLATPHNEHRAVISPDGRWVAYESDRTGRPEVYVRALASPDAGEWPISTKGGRGPKWQRGGHKLFYVSADWQIISAEPGPAGNWHDVKERVLFEIPGRTQPPGMPPTFDVTRAGQRFLIGPPAMAGQDPPVTVAINWHPPGPTR